MKIIIVAGARPNFMKIAPILRSIEEAKQNEKIETVLVHTGQHYDTNMSQTFFDELGIKKPDYNLEVGSSSHSVQTAEIMVKFEEVCTIEKPDFVIVVGDVNSTVAAGLVAKKMNIDLVHIEAGLRSWDRRMPEEINRMVTDSITDIFFTTEPNGTKNLLNEGHSDDRICFVGHVMIDNLMYQLKNVDNSASSKIKLLKKNLNKYLCMTLHRPSNVDSEEKLIKIISAIDELAKTYRVPVIFPCHPRTLSRIEAISGEKNVNILDVDSYKGENLEPGIHLVKPLGYNDFLLLWKDCVAVLTDSGGLQEETTALQVPCLTLRENTERPITCDIGTNTLIGTDMDLLKDKVKEIFERRYKEGQIPERWDGKASNRIVEVLYSEYIKKL